MSVTTRKGFLVVSSVGSAIIAACAPTSAGQTPLQSGNDFDRVTLKHVKHRHAFGIASINGGKGLFAMDNDYRAYRALNVTLSSASLIGVVYHTGAALALNDRIWNELLIPVLPKLRQAGGDFGSVPITTGNPVLGSLRDSAGNEASFQSLVARGSKFFVCNDSLVGLASLFAQMLNRSAQEVYREVSVSLVPGASLVPAASWAIHTVHERGFSYMSAAE